MKKSELKYLIKEVVEEMASEENTLKQLVGKKILNVQYQPHYEGSSSGNIVITMSDKKSYIFSAGTDENVHVKTL